MMQRCSERAFAMCPNRHLCGPIHEAIFSDNSDCAEYNRKAESTPVTNADRIRAMSDEELANMCIAYNPETDLYIADTGEAYCDFESAMEAELEWLKQPAEGA